jgi:hypothetical protein
MWHHGGERAWSIVRDDDIDVEPHKLVCHLREAFAASFCPAVLNRDIAALGPSEFAQAIQKSGGPWALRCRSARAH